MPHHQTRIAMVKPTEAQRERYRKLIGEHRLTLVPEPTNPYDPNAVQIHHDGVMIGYVPRDLAAEVGRLHAAGRVTHVKPRDEGSGIEIHYEENPK